MTWNIRIIKAIEEVTRADTDLVTAVLEVLDLQSKLSEMQDIWQGLLDRVHEEQGIFVERA
jgi:hypothetical protein